LDGLPVTTGAVDSKEASPISLHAQELPGNEGLRIHVAVNPDFLDPAEANSLASLLQTAIHKFVEDAGTPVEELPIASASEREHVVETWNQTGLDFSLGTLDGLFTSQVKATPDAIAVVGLNGDELSYGELDVRSTQLAKHLVSVGVGAEKVVGVKMVRSTETVIAILGILKAGGAYLPLDPAYPPERLEYIAGNAGAMLVLESIEGLSVDAELTTLTDRSRLAYVIYTSGTTGQPKGVAVAHSAAVNLAFARRACHDPLGVGDRVLAAISVGFDVSIGQLLLPLLSGATVVIAGDVKTMGAGEFWSLLAQRGVTHINSVPSFFESILEAVPPAGTLSLKRLMLGGEALSGALVGRIHKAIPGIEVVNMYGPTEACIDATYHVATGKDLSLAVLPIGKPLSNYQAYVLDSQKQPVGVGVSGELYLGGAGLARGYVNAADLTAERFVDSPLIPGAKLYKTGDRARWTAEGEIEFLGRVDQQVKIRGFRVEPGEIEAQLRQLPGVREAAVVTDGSAGSARLIAYCTGEVVPETLRAGLASTLPDYMVPSAFVKIDALPLTANGKLDRKALPKPEQDAFASRAYEAPIGDVEQKMAGLWAELLKLDRVGRNDNFFQIGGDSLAVMRMVQSLNQTFGVTVPIRNVFQNPTIAALSAKMSESGKSKTRQNLVPLKVGGTKPPIYYVHASSGHVFRYMALVNALGNDQPAYGLQASGLEAGETLGESIESMAKSYIDAIKEFQPAGPYRLLGYSSGGLLAFEMAQQLRQRGDVVDFLAILDTTLPNPRANRVPTDDEVVLDMASAMGLADLVGTRSPLPSLAELVDIARKAGRVPADFQTVHVERMAGVFRNTVRTCPDYKMCDWPGSMLLIRAKQRPLRAGPMVNWSPYVSGPMDVVDLDCSHPNLIAPEMAAEVANVILSRLSPSAEKQANGKSSASGDKSLQPTSSGKIQSFLRKMMKSGGKKP
jgi:amino acid adenylation domain-containing protein